MVLAIPQRVIQTLICTRADGGVIAQRPAKRIVSMSPFPRWALATCRSEGAASRARLAAMADTLESLLL